MPMHSRYKEKDRREYGDEASAPNETIASPDAMSQEVIWNPHPPFPFP